MQIILPMNSREEFSHISQCLKSCQMNVEILPYG